MGNSKADLVLRNAGAITLDPRRPQARTIYVRGGHILKVSSKDVDPDLAGAATKFIDCRGRTVIPAFHDAHCHVEAYAESLLNIDLSPACVKSIEDIVNRIKEAASALPAGTWIRCAGYNEFYLAEKRHPTARDLDRATVDHPVKLTQRSGHAHVLNSAALALAGITGQSEEPSGGMIERDMETGEPNGLLFGMGTCLSEKIPPVGDAELEGAMSRAGRTLLSMGITTAQDASPGNGRECWTRFLDWKRRGVFLPRIIMMSGAEEAAHFHGGQTPEESETGLLRGAVKIMLDEVRGSLNPSQAELNRLMLEIHGRGQQVAIHAVEETTIDAAITAIEQAMKHRPRKDSRHRLEHCSVCTPEAAARLSRLGAAAVTNPAFIYYSGERYLSTLPREQLRRLYAIKTMLGEGLRVAAGSDAPVAGPDPLKGICAAVTRRAETGQEITPGEAISALDALRLYTVNAAYSCFLEGKSGSLSKGRYADLVVLSGDPLQANPAELKDLKVETTLMDGKVVYGEAI
ncbi:MAG: amidohydrolase [Chloroflexi bacterium]|nr:amidohydrolase [Chloroflexota bacterium]